MIDNKYTLQNLLKNILKEYKVTRYTLSQLEEDCAQNDKPVLADLLVSAKANFYHKVEELVISYHSNKQR